MLLKYLKRPVSEHLWTVTMLKCQKDCLKLQGSIFVIFFDHSETNSPQVNKVFNQANSNAIISK